MPNLLYSMNSYSMNRQSVGAWLHLSEGADNTSVAASPGHLSYACNTQCPGNCQHYPIS